jgi:hypothetical protein
MAASSIPLLGWGSTGVVDTLAVSFSIAAFYQFSKFYVRGENTLLWAGLLSVAAFFTKQSMLAGPAAMCVLLLFKNRKTAILFGAALGGTIAALALGINAALNGRFFADTVFAMIQPFELDKVWLHAQYVGLVSGALILVFAATVAHLARSRSVAILVYFGFAVLILAAMTPKTGSDSNYHIEPTLLLIACVSAGLVEINFFELCFRNSKSWVTLLQIPVGLFLVMNYRLVVPEMLNRYFRETQARAEMTAVEPYIRAASGPIFAAEMDPVVRIRGRLDVEPIIYSLLVAAGRIDPELVRKDLSRGAIPLVILYEDLSNPLADQSREIGRLLPIHAEEVREHYHLVEHIPGPNLGGIYVYQPNSLISYK